jgi:hypothetical protein
LPLSLDSLTDIDWEEATFNLVPSYAELPMQSNAASIWRALADDVEPPVAATLMEPVNMRIWRKGLTPQFATMNTLEFESLNLIKQGNPFGKVCAELAAKYPETDITTNMAKNLHVWLTDELFTN